jgi:hypothetical protein
MAEAPFDKFCFLSWRAKAPKGYWAIRRSGGKPKISDLGHVAAV